MLIPTLPQIKDNLELFTAHSEIDINQNARHLISMLDDLDKKQLLEEEREAFFNEVLRLYQHANSEFEVVYQELISFKKVLYHVCLYMVYHYPRNDKTVNNEPLDPISQETIPLERLFLSFDQRHWDILKLVRWITIKGKFENPITRQLFLPEEKIRIEKMASVMFFQAVAHLNSMDDELIYQGLLYFLECSDSDIMTVEIISRVVGLLGSLNEKISFSSLALLKFLSDKNTVALMEIRKAGGIPLLVSFLRHEDETMIENALFVIMHLLMNVEQLKEVGILPVLFMLLNHQNQFIVGSSLFLIASFLYNNAELNQNEESIFPLLTTLLNHQNQGVVRNTLTVIELLLMDNGLNQNALREAGAIVVLLSYLKKWDVDEDIVEQVVKICSILACGNPLNGYVFRAEEAIEIVVLTLERNRNIMSRNLEYNLIHLLYVLIIFDSVLFKNNEQCIDLNKEFSFVKIANKKMCYLESALILFYSNGHFGTEKIACFLLNNIDFVNLDVDVIEPQILRDIQFNSFIQFLCQKITDTKEKSKCYAECIQLLLTAKKSLMLNSNEDHFVQDCVTAIATLKPYIHDSTSGCRKRLFMAEDVFQKQVDAIEQRLHACLPSKSELRP